MSVLLQLGFSTVTAQIVSFSAINLNNSMSWIGQCGVFFEFPEVKVSMVYHLDSL